MLVSPVDGQKKPTGSVEWMRTGMPSSPARFHTGYRRRSSMRRGTRLAEIRVDRNLNTIALSPNGRFLFVSSNFLDDEIELYAQIEVCDARPGNPALPRRPELPGRVPDRATACGQDLLPQAAFSAASYHLLEDPDVMDRFRSDPQGFLDDLRLPAILDEVPRRMGQWFLTGSREAALMMNVTESMAGRAAVLQLLPLSARESSRVSILSGGYPEALARPGASSLWFSSYVQAYLERDVRSASAVHDLQAFRA